MSPLMHVATFANLNSPHKEIFLQNASLFFERFNRYFSTFVTKCYFKIGPISATCPSRTNLHFRSISHVIPNKVCSTLIRVSERGDKDSAKITHILTYIRTLLWIANFSFVKSQNGVRIVTRLGIDGQEIVVRLPAGKNRISNTHVTMHRDKSL
jgi:hypothetical protein